MKVPGPIAGSLSAIILAGMSAITLTSCGIITGVDVDRFMIRVDSMSVPEVVLASDTLRVVLYGAVGSDGCYRFDHLAEVRVAGRLDLTVWGEHEKRSGTSCTQTPVYMRQEFAIVPPIDSPLDIVVHQPDGTELRRTVAQQARVGTR